jgi:hypothetical protein
VFRTPTGERVRYVNDQQGGLDAYRRGTRVYIGFGAWQRRDERNLWELIQSGRLTLATAGES